MFNMRAEEAVRALVEAVLPLPEGSGLFVMLDVRLQHPEHEKRRASGNVCFVFERPQNYCKVWSARGESWATPELAAYEMLCDHDSCWRGAIGDAVSKEYFRQARAISGKLPPCKMVESCYVHRVGRVSLAYEPVDPQNPHKKRLTRLEKLV